jgi:ketosteroid isomerase-like protein
MDKLRFYLVKNQNNLDRLRLRTRYCRAAIVKTDCDLHKESGFYTDYWDEWQEQAEQILEDLSADMNATAHFAGELREFIMAAEADVKKGNAHMKRLAIMNALAAEAIACQSDMLHITDERIAEHREFTHKLLLVEALDRLSEE